MVDHLCFFVPGWTTERRIAFCRPSFCCFQGEPCDIDSHFKKEEIVMIHDHQPVVPSLAETEGG